jgi:hypothetical protein
VGKTTLALKLAARAARSGCRTAVLAWAPRHPWLERRLEAAAEQCRIETALASDPDSLRSALHYLGNPDLFILDLPPMEDRHWELLESVEADRKDEPLLRHLVVAADGGWRGLGEAVRRCDYVAVARADLGEPILPCLDLALAGPGEVNFSFVSGGEQAGGVLGVLRPKLLLEGLKRRFQRAEGAEVGGRA